MNAKTANVVARVEPDVKEKAEAILATLGVSASATINMLYKQIILTRSIPFSISIPAAPLARDEMDGETFNAMIQEGLDDIKAGRSRPATEVFADVRRELGLNG